MSMILDSMMSYRRKRAQVKRPDFALASMLLFSRDKQGEKQKPLQSIGSMYKAGSYYGDKFADWLGGLFTKAEVDEDLDHANRLAGLDWDKMKVSDEVAEDAEDAAKGPGTSVGMAESAEVGKFYRMNAGSNVEVYDSDFRVYVNIDGQENRVASEYIDPSRQVRKNEDPWPLDKPKEDQVSPRRKLTGPAKLASIESPEAQARRHASANPTTRSGKAAFERGAARAREIAKQRQSQPARKPKGRTGPERD